MGFSNIKPKRSLGQNFFINQNLGKHIVEKVLETQPDSVLEIGSGKGFFTKIFVEKNVEVICVEKDDQLAQKLRIFLPQVEVKNESIIDVNVDKTINKGKETVCFGSLPYNLAKQIISLVLKSNKIDNYYFIVQKEVAEKYLQKNKTSILSLKTELYAKTKILLNISPHNFTPKPNVESSLIHLSKHSRIINESEENEFLNYLYSAFKQPRKKLKNNLRKNYEIEKIKDENFLEKRAEDLNLQEHIRIWREISSFPQKAT